MTSATLTRPRRDGTQACAGSAAVWASAAPAIGTRAHFERMAAKTLPGEPTNRRPCGRYASARMEEAWQLYQVTTGALA